MTYLGTRPPTEDEWEKYSAHHRGRMAIKPGIFNISLLISKNRDRKRKLCKFEPSMTELRQMRHHGLCLERNYEDDSLDGIINNA